MGLVVDLPEWHFVQEQHDLGVRLLRFLSGLEGQRTLKRVTEEGV